MIASVLFADHLGAPIKVGTRVAGDMYHVPGNPSKGSRLIWGTVIELDDYYEPADVNGDGLSHPRILISWQDQSLGHEWVRASYSQGGYYDDDVWIIEDIEFAI
jgi:hypothetical protein